MTFRTAYDALQEFYSLKSGLVCPVEEDRAQQQFKEECDINNIARRFGLTGLLPVTSRPLSYAEFDDVFDFQSAMNAVREAGQAFLGLPSAVREKFNHDPQKFLEFCDSAKIEDFHALGLTRDGFKLPVKAETPPKSE